MGTTITPTPQQAAEAKIAQQSLRAALGGRSGRNRHLGTVVIRGADGDVTVPEPVTEIVLKALDEVAHGRAVEINTVEEELTTQQAAGMLNVSRPFLIKLLSEGVMPFRMVGSHRRVKRDDVVSFKERQDQASREALADLARIS
ncbi:MAG: helix-turn-helix domain-containing protein, partial [Gemmatimonadales bacterium]